MDASSKSDASEGERSGRRYRTLDEKLQILAEATRPGASMALVARKYGMNANLLFAWRRLQQQGLLESQRHAPAPLLPVKIKAPTITPSEPSTVTVRRRHLTSPRIGKDDRVHQRDGGHMDTKVAGPEDGRRRRRYHSAQFKAESVAACRQPGVSIAAVALSRSLNANLLRNWVVAAEREEASSGAGERGITRCGWRARRSCRWR